MTRTRLVGEKPATLVQEDRPRAATTDTAAMAANCGKDGARPVRNCRGRDFRVASIRLSGAPMRARAGSNMGLLLPLIVQGGNEESLRLSRYPGNGDTNGKGRVGA